LLVPNKISNILTILIKETSTSRLLRIVSTDFLALHLFCFSIHQHGCQILYFKLHVDGRKFHYRSLHAAVAAGCVHRWSRPGVPNLFAISYHLETLYCQLIPLTPEKLIWSNLSLCSVNFSMTGVDLLTAHW